MRVLFFDIDGTLLDHTGRMPESTRRALLLAKEKGHSLILCSGRSKCAVKQLMERFGFDGCVCSAGAYIEYHQRIVDQTILKKSQQDKLVDFFEQTGAVYGLQCSENIVCPSELYDTYEKNFAPGEEEPSESDVPADDNSRLAEEDEKLDDIGKTFIFVDDIRSVENAEKAFYYGANVGVIEAGRILGPEFDVRPASYNMPDENNGEISLSGITKSYGIQKLLDYLQMDKADTVAFGDGYNDLEMLESVGFGVAMGNAVEQLKEAADYVTDSVDEDGIYRAMKYLELI